MAELSKGVELRANMDLEIARALILINGAGIIAILAFLQSTVEWVRYASFAKPAIAGIGLLAFPSRSGSTKKEPLMATTLIVSYDLRKSRNYPLMYKALDTLKAAKLLESLWLVTLAPNVGVIRLRDAIMSAARMDGDDGLIVIELKKTSDWATYNAQKTGLAWLRANIP